AANLKSATSSVQSPLPASSRNALLAANDTTNCPPLPSVALYAGTTTLRVPLGDTNVTDSGMTPGGGDFLPAGTGLAGNGYELAKPICTVSILLTPPPRTFRRAGAAFPPIAIGASAGAAALCQPLSSNGPRGLNEAARVTANVASTRPKPYQLLKA